MGENYVVKIYGLVTRPFGETRVAVERGVYAMEEISIDRYRFANDAGFSFELTLLEVSTYMGSQMKVIEGRWP